MKTTAADFTIFKKEAKDYLKFFGLTDWYVYFAHEDVVGHDEAAAMFEMDFSNRVANLTLIKTWETKPTPEMLRRAAFHEVIHVLFSRLHALAGHRETSEQAIENEIHAIIRRLENSVFERMDENCEAD